MSSRLRSRSHRRHSSRPPVARNVVLPEPTSRSLRVELLEWALAHGRAVGADAASAVLAAKSARGPEPLGLFTDDIVTELLWVDVYAWCGEHAVPPPPLVGATLAALIDLLSERRRLAPGSAPVDELHEAIAAAGGTSVEQPRLPGIDAPGRGAEVAAIARLDPA